MFEQKKPVRVLYIVASCEVVGGIETNLLTVLDNTAEVGLEVVGVLVPGEGKYTEMLRQRGIQVRSIDYYGWHWRSPWRYIQTCWQLWHAIRELQPNIVHLVHHWLVEYVWVLGHLFSQPVICDLANLENEAFIQQREKFFASLNTVVVRSNAIRDNLRKYSRREIATALIPYGVETAKFAKASTKPKLRSELRLSADTPIVGFIGRLVGWKGVEDLLAAWPCVQANYPRARLLIVGEDDQDGRYRMFLEQRAEILGIASSVLFLGFRSDINAIMHNLDVFVLPSHNEPFGIVTVEAMASGSLIVGTDSGGTPEIIDHMETGYLAPMANPKALAEGIEWCLALSPEKAKSIQVTAQRKAQEHFDIWIQLQAQVELYHELLKAR